MGKKGFQVQGEECGSSLVDRVGVLVKKERKTETGMVGVSNGINHKRCQEMRQECSAVARNCAREFVLHPATEGHC